MPFHHLKRLNPHSRFHKHLSIHSNLNNDDFLRQSPKYKKYFDYSLDELLVDHSTDPLQNTTRQYVKNSSISSIDNANDPGRFAHHQMIIRQEKGETKLLRPKSDPVLIKGFTKKIQHSSTVPSGPSVVTRPISHNASISMIKKMKKTQKYPHRRPPKSAFTPLPMDNYRNDIDERQAMQFDQPSFYDDIHQASTETFYPPLVPLMNVIPRYPPSIELTFRPPAEEHFCREPPRISPVRPYSEYSFDYCREDYRRSPIDPMFYFNHPSDSYRFDYVANQSSRYFQSNSIHRSDYSF